MASIAIQLAARKQPYSDQATFFVTAWPFALKLLWAPVVDAFYWRRLGRRKSWCVHSCIFVALCIWHLCHMALWQEYAFLHIPAFSHLWPIMYCLSSPFVHPSKYQTSFACSFCVFVYVYHQKHLLEFGKLLMNILRK